MREEHSSSEPSVAEQVTHYEENTKERSAALSWAMKGVSDYGQKVRRGHPAVAGTEGNSNCWAVTDLPRRPWNSLRT